MLVKDLMRKAHTVDPKRSVKDAALHMTDRGSNVLVIVEEGKIKGLVTNTDIVAHIATRDVLAKDIAIEDIMVKDVKSIDENEDIEKAADIMGKYKIQKIPITSKGDLIGIIIAEDILSDFENKRKMFVIRETVIETYKIMQADPKADDEHIIEEIRKTHDYSGMHGIEVNLFAVQEGAVLVAYNYFKENPKADLKKAVEHIEENYLELLSKYSEYD